MIQHVESGDKLTTSLVNSIIDKANGQQIPSNNGFINERNGTLFYDDKSFPDKNKYADVPVFLECRGFDEFHFQLQKFPFDYQQKGARKSASIAVNLGGSLNEAKSLLKLNGESVEYILIVGKSSESEDGEEQESIFDEAVEIKEEFFKPSDSEQLSSIIHVNTGFIDVGFSGVVNGCFMKGISESDSASETCKPIYVLTNYSLTNENDVKELKEKCRKFLGDGSNAVIYHPIKLYSSTEPNKKNISEYVQNILGAQIVDVVYPTDSEIDLEGFNQKSLEVTSFTEELKGEDENSEISAGESKEYVQLYGFDNEETIKLPSNNDPELSNYHFIVRRVIHDEENKLSSREIAYVNLSNLGMDDYVGDANLSSLDISSVVQKEHIVTEISADLSSETKTKYFQLYNFDDATYIKDELSKDDEQKLDIVVREKTDDGRIAVNYIPYKTPLSVDSEFDKQRSIQNKKDVDDEYLQLYGFDNTEPTKIEVEDLKNYHMLVRNNETATLEYTPITTNNIAIVSTDTGIEELHQQSIQNKITDDGSYIQLYGFDNEETTVLSDNVGNYDILARERKADGNLTLSYVTLSSLSSSLSSKTLSTDSELGWFYNEDQQYESNNKSIDKKKYNDGEYLQIHNFDVYDWIDDISAEENLYADIIVRRYGDYGDMYIDYINLDALKTIPEIRNPKPLSADSDITSLNQKSIDQKTDSKNSKYFQLHNFDKSESTALSDFSRLPDIVVRSNNTLGSPEIQYIPFTNLLSGYEMSVINDSLNGDANIQSKSKTASIQKALSSNEEYYRLYKFDDASYKKTYTVGNTDFIPNFTDFKIRGFPYGAKIGDFRDLDIPLGTDILQRKKNEQGIQTLEYDTIKLKLPMPPTDTTKSEDIGISPYYGFTPLRCSIDAYDEDRAGSMLQLYNFEKSDNVLDLNPSQFSTRSSRQNNTNYRAENAILIRRYEPANENHRDGQMQVDYMSTNSLASFIELSGDSDYTPAKSKSIKFVPASGYSPTDTPPYFKLHNFDNSSSNESVKTDIQSDGYYYDIVTGKAADYSSNDNYYILTKHVDNDGNSELEYKQIALKIPEGSGGATSEELEELKERVDNIEIASDSLCATFEHISGDVNDLSTDLSSLSGDVWLRGEGYDVNFGSSIGNSNEEEIINLDEQVLHDPTGREWTVKGGLNVQPNDDYPFARLNVGGSAFLYYIDYSNDEFLLEAYIKSCGITGFGNGFYMQHPDLLLYTDNPGITMETDYSMYINAAEKTFITSPSVDITGNVNINGDSNITNHLSVGTDITTTNVKTNTITTTDSITIGGLTLNEEKLAKLLALINELPEDYGT